MKYNEQNPPLVCMQTQSTCYKQTKPLKQIYGVLWHDTGANNANLKRYVQPSDDAPDKNEMLQILGKNTNRNDWNHTNRQAGMNCFVGKLADGTVATVQTMPWNYKPWGCGKGANGSCNDGWIQFEICEDGKTNREYFELAYREACEITAYLCEKFGIDPKGIVEFQGLTVPTILCHRDSCRMGLGGIPEHEDIYDWFPNFGKNMETVREDVERLMNQEEVIWNFLLRHIGNAYGVAGLMGNLYAESGLRANNLQNTYERAFGLTDAEYTRNVDNGIYTDFADDHAGYGLAQWTYPTHKQLLLDFAKARGVSIGDLSMQLDFLWEELNRFTAVLSVLKSAKSIREASDVVLTKYEKPADQSEAVQEKRAKYGQEIYSRYVKTAEPTLVSSLRNGSSGDMVKRVQEMLLVCGYSLGDYGADGKFGAKTTAAVRKFQKDQGLYVDGVVGKKTYAALLQAYENLNPVPQPEPEPVEPEPIEDNYTVIIPHLTKEKAQQIIALYGGELTEG